MIDFLVRRKKFMYRGMLSLSVLILLGCGSENESRNGVVAPQQGIEKSVKNEFRVAVLGSSQSMGFPYAGKSWVDIFEQAVLQNQTKATLFKKWLSYDMSMTKMMELDAEISEFKPNLLLLQVSAGDALIEAFRQKGEILPIFREFSAVNLWEGVAPVALDQVKWDVFLKKWPMVKCHVFVIGPCSWRRGLPPLGEEPPVAPQSKWLELQAIEKLGHENILESPQYALGCFNRLVTLEPERATYHYALAAQAERLGLYDVFIQSYLSAVEMDPLPLRGSIKEWLALKKSCKQDGIKFFDLQKLIDGLDEKKMANVNFFYDAIHLREPSLKMFLEMLYLEIFGKQDYKDRQAFFGIVDWKSVEVNKWLNINRSLVASRSFSMASPALDHTLQKVNQSPELLKMAHFVAEETGQLDKAQAALLLLVKKEPFNQDAWRKLISMFYKAAGWQAVLAFMPMVPCVFYEMPMVLAFDGLELMRQDHLQAAEVLIKEAYLKNSEDAIVKEAMVELLIKKKQTAQALALWEDDQTVVQAQFFFDKVKVWVFELWADAEQLQVLQLKMEKISLMHPKHLALKALNVMVLWHLGEWEQVGLQASQIKALALTENIPINIAMLDEAVDAAAKKSDLDIEKYRKWYLSEQKD